MSANVAVHVFTDRSELRNDLNARRTNTNNGNALVGEVVLLVPTGRVNELSFEVLKTFDARPLPITVPSLA